MCEKSGFHVEEKLTPASRCYDDVKEWSGPSLAPMIGFQKLIDVGVNILTGGTVTVTVPQRCTDLVSEDFSFQSKLRSGDRGLRSGVRGLRSGVRGPRQGSGFREGSGNWGRSQGSGDWLSLFEESHKFVPFVSDSRLENHGRTGKPDPTLR